jgi:hypothetical protein
MKEERIKGNGAYEKKGEKQKGSGDEKKEKTSKTKVGGPKNKENKTQMVRKDEENKKRGFHQWQLNLLA